MRQFSLASLQMVFAFSEAQENNPAGFSACNAFKNPACSVGRSSLGLCCPS